MYYLCTRSFARGPGIKKIHDIMKPHKEVRISGWAAHMTTGVSVTLALLTIGLIAMIWIAASAESRRMMEKIEISVVIADSVGDSRAIAVCEAIERLPYATNVRYISRDQALDDWKKTTGEDLEYVFGVNPLSPEIAFTLPAEYSSVNSIAKIKTNLSAIAGVEEVATPDSSLIEAMNRNISRLTIGFAVLAAIMLVISFVLINNTVRLSIYSRRFTIHTMQLVGATDGFIRRPFVNANALVGLISGFIAGGLLAVVLAVCPGLGLESLQRLVTWNWMVVIVAALLVVGIMICALAAALATTRHLRQDYEDLFK